MLAPAFAALMSVVRAKSHNDRRVLHPRFCNRSVQQNRASEYSSPLNRPECAGLLARLGVRVERAPLPAGGDMKVPATPRMRPSFDGGLYKIAHSPPEGGIIPDRKGRQVGVFLGQVKREAQVAASMLTSDEQGGFMRLTNFAVDDGPHNSDGLMLYGWHGINR